MEPEDKIDPKVLADMHRKIICDFLEEMGSQDNRSTAFPFYFVIRTSVKNYTSEDYGDHVEYYSNKTESSYETIDDFRRICRESGNTPDEIEEEVGRLHRNYYTWEWQEAGMFLTESDARLHLDSNPHHYSEDAHTYVKHAWRAPQLRLFFKSLFAHFNVENKHGF